MSTRTIQVFIALVIFGGSLTEALPEEKENRFRLLTTEEGFEALFKRYEKTLLRAYQEAEAGIIPVNTLQINQVVKDGNAARAGIEPGSRLIQLGDYRPWADAFPLIRSDEPSSALIITPDNYEIEVDVEPGSLQAYSSGIHGLELAYLRGEIGVRNELWDDFITLACCTKLNSLSTMESCLHKAIEAGYEPDSFTDIFHVIIYSQTRWGPSGALDQFFSNFKADQEIPWAYFPILHNALVASGRIDYMERLLSQVGDNTVFTREVIDQFLEWRNNQVKFPDKPLIERVMELERTSIADNFYHNVENHGAVPGEEMGAEFKISTRYPELYKTEYKSSYIPQNFHYQIEVKMAQNTLHGRTSSFIVLIANLFDEDEAVPEDIRYGTTGISHPYRLMYLKMGKRLAIVPLEVSANSIPGTAYSRQPYWKIPFTANPHITESARHWAEPFRSSFGEEPPVHKFDFIRLGNEMAIFVNNLVYLHQPTDPAPTREIDFNLHCRGLDVEILSHDIWELHEGDSD
ncbi:MAG: hypothetical protein P1U58_14980 [Verrucomicrobiales bacterium]|nr:hypothetical protein [Verrucomicrobiales bacterium]